MKYNITTKKKFKLDKHSFTTSKSKRKDNIIITRQCISKYLKKNYSNTAFVCFITSLGEPFGEESEKIFALYPVLKKEIENIKEIFGRISLLDRIFLPVGSAYILPVNPNTTIILTSVMYTSNSKLTDMNIRICLHSINNICMGENYTSCIIPAVGEYPSRFMDAVTGALIRTNNIWYANNTTSYAPGTYTACHEEIYRLQDTEPEILEFNIKDKITDIIDFYSEPESESESSDSEYQDTDTDTDQ